jgi:hypothetical protein
MTSILDSEMYEFPNDHDTATCEDCGAEMDVPPIDDVDADFKEPHFRRQEHLPPCEDVWEALCDDCYSEAVSKILEEDSA